jgi:hypothetical protein
MNSKHKKTLQAIFHDPILTSIHWREIENMLQALGATVEERAGSRVGIVLNRIVAVFHRPHPQKETDKGAVKSMRRFLTEAGVKL